MMNSNIELENKINKLLGKVLHCIEETAQSLLFLNYR